MSREKHEDTEREDTRKPGRADRVDDAAAADAPPPTPPPADKDGVQPHPKDTGGKRAA